jgi:hypothetical protein
MGEIGVDAFTQILGLADIDYLPGLILKEISTWFLGKFPNTFTRQHAAPSSKKWEASLLFRQSVYTIII